LPKIEHFTIEVGNQSHPILSLLLSNRKNNFPDTDELLFHSGGPVTDLSEYSFFPSIDSIRILFIEPENNNIKSNTSALEGQISFNFPNPLHMLVQEMKDGRWITSKEYRPNDLEAALNIVEDYEIKCDMEDDLPINPGGFAGLLGYDINRWTNPIHLNYTPEFGTLLGVLWRTEAWWIHERLTNQLHLVSVEGHKWSKAKLPDNFTNTIRFPDPVKGQVPDSESDAEHARKISKIKDAITKGNLYQVNYGRTWKGDMPDHPWNAFLRMTKGNPSPFSSWLYVHDHGWAISSSSPERLLKIDAEKVQTRPIKGTKSRGSNNQSDISLRLELASSPKELAEHLMLVDLERHDLTPICSPGTVHWSDWRIEALSTVQHLVSSIEGKLLPQKSAGDALVSLFPGGSITGCPKTVSIAAIDELEQHPRGAWTGSIGHIHFKSKKSEWNILIRTLEAFSGPNSWSGTVQAGGGIVIDSIPSEEVEEARWKAAAITEATWGFRTGFSGNDLPKRKVKILAVPKVSGPLGELKPQILTQTRPNGFIFRNDEKSNNDQILIIDNLDSFTENIASILSISGVNVRIVKGRPLVPYLDPTNIIENWIKVHEPTHIIIGPGPSRPDKSEITMKIAEMAIQGNLRCNGMHIPLLGLCLGHQAIGQAVGWKLVESPLGAVHGLPSIIRHDSMSIYQSLPNPLVLMRYNSLILSPTNDLLIPTAWDETNTLIMGLRHPSLPVFGIQFHPESVGSPMGQGIIMNFIKQKPMSIVELYVENKINEP